MSEKPFTEERKLNLLTNAYYDLFSVKGMVIDAKTLKRWLIGYTRRETFRARMKKSEQNKNLKKSKT
jgi:hypothetical protein